MKKALLLTLSLFVWSLNPIQADDGVRMFSKGSIFLGGQIGLNTIDRTVDPYAEPFDALPFPVGASIEWMLTGNIGVGGTLMYDQWSDYLGMFGGKWTFRLFKPSFDIAFHLGAGRIRGLDFIAGANLGYSFVFASNELGNPYNGRLKSEPYLAPFVGLNLRLWPNSPGFAGRIMVSFKAAWSATGRFSGVYGLAGLTYQLK
jgi:hypothetical protein